MIQANELRIGNWVKVHLTGEYLQVDWLAMKHISDGNIQSAYTPNIPVYEPIPLTPELVEKCGLNKDEDGIYVIHVQGLGLYWVTDPEKRFEPFIQIAEGYAPYLNLNDQCLHQLQNIYFCLAGVEMEVKL